MGVAPAVAVRARAAGHSGTLPVTAVAGSVGGAAPGDREKVGCAGSTHFRLVGFRPLEIYE